MIVHVRLPARENQTPSLEFLIWLSPWRVARLSRLRYNGLAVRQHQSPAGLHELLSQGPQRSSGESATFPALVASSPIPRGLLVALQRVPDGRERLLEI